MLKQLSLFVALALTFVCNAQYVATDLSYTCLGAGKYKVKLDVYTECGTDGGFVLGFQFPLYVTSAKLNANLGEIYFDKSTTPREHIKLFCTNEQDNCSNPTSPFRGLQKYVFYKTIDLSKYGPTDDWKLAFIYDFKDKAFFNMVLPEKYAHINTTQINTTGGLCNNSPQYDEYPILKSCVGQTDTISLGIRDTDNHKLTYTLVAPITQVNMQTLEMTYKPNFSKDKPMELAQNLKVTPEGKLIVKGTKVNDIGAVDILIEEYDNNGQKIATTRRNIQINTLNCNNQIPTISDLVTPRNPLSKKEIIVCSKEVISKTHSLFNISDPDNTLKSIEIRPRNTQVSSNIFQVVKSADGRSAQVFASEAPVFETDKDVSIIIDVKVTDNGCPETSNTESFTLTVKAKPFFDFGYDWAYLSCNPSIVLNPSNIHDMVPNDTILPENLKGTAPFTYQWKTWNYSMQGFYYVIKSNVYTSPTVSQHTVDVINHGITLKVTDSTGCSAIDSIYFQNGLVFQPDIKNRCFANDSTLFFDQSYSSDTLSPIIRRTWKFGDGDEHTSANDAIIKKKYCKEGIYPISLEIETAKGCKSKYEDSLRIYSLPEPNFDVTVNCARRMFITDISSFIPPIKGSLMNFRSTPYDIKYYVTRVHNGQDTTLDVKVQTTVKLNVVCDSIYVTFLTDSSAGSCSHKDITPRKTYKFSYLNLPTSTISKVFNITQSATEVLLNFKYFVFGSDVQDTVLLNKAVTINFSKADLLARKVVPPDTFLLQDKVTGILKKCKAFVHEDTLNRDILIPAIGSTNDPDDYAFPNLMFDWEKQNRTQIDSGLYLVKQVLQSNGNCRVETTKEVTVYAEPQVTIGDASRTLTVSSPLTQNCLNGDTTLYARILNNPNGGLKYAWRFKPSEQNIDNPSFLSTIDQHTTADTGLYYLYVQDRYSCDDTASVRLVSYLKPDFELATECDINNKNIRFLNFSATGAGPKVIKSTWTITDGNNNQILYAFDSAALDFTKLVVANTDKINVTLLTTDSLNCKRSVTKDVLRTDFKENLELSGASFCVSDKIKAKAIDLVIQPSHIDSIVWDLGDGRKAIQLGNPQGTTQAQLDNYFITYPDDNLYTVKFKVYYNGITKQITDGSGQVKDTIIKHSCLYTSQNDTTIGIKPEFKGKVFEYRNCVNDTSEFIFEKDPAVGDQTAKVQS
ncbi:MAG TPA: PKD domain-containing protein, partial [Cytophagales bacterium]|nr:PKD domain-containing protein [Cytophagales bacterium]